MIVNAIGNESVIVLAEKVTRVCIIRRFSICFYGVNSIESVSYPFISLFNMNFEELNTVNRAMKEEHLELNNPLYSKNNFFNIFYVQF